MVQPYFAKRKMPAGVGAVKMDWPSFHAGREQAAIAEFSRAFGALGALAEKRMNAMAQAEFITGKVDWETANNLFFEGLRDDPDHRNYTKKYDAYSKKIQKNILSTKSPITKRVLSQMFESEIPDVKKLVGNVAWERQRSADAAGVLTAVRKFELSSNGPAAEAALLEAVNAGIIKAEVAAGRALQIKRNLNWYEGLEIIESDPGKFIDMAAAEVESRKVEHGPKFEFLTNLDPAEKLELLNKARTKIASISREQAEALKLQQEQTASQFLADLWDNKLNNPQDITDALRKGWLSDVNAKYLRKALLNKEPPKTDLRAYAEVKKAINDLGRGAKTINQTLDVVYQNVDRLDPTTGKSLVGEIFGEHDKYDSDMEKEGRDLMEELIREKDPVSGMFTDNAREIIGTAEALVELDASIKNAIERGKPLIGKDLLIEAIKIGRLKSREIKEEEPPEFKYRKKPPDLSGQEAVLGLGKGKFIPDDTRLYMEPPGYKGTGKEWNALSDKEKENLWLKQEGKSTPPKKMELPTPKTKSEYDKLKSGTKYIDPDGVERIKK